MMKPSIDEDLLEEIEDSIREFKRNIWLGISIAIMFISMVSLFLQLNTQPPIGIHP